MFWVSRELLTVIVFRMEADGKNPAIRLSSSAPEKSSGMGDIEVEDGVEAEESP